MEDKYFKIVAQEDGDTAEILLYGFIGEVRNMWDERDEDKSNTDVEFARTLSDLEKRYSRINLRINSPGGSMYHGNAIVSAIRRSKAEIHTYNDGLAASMAADIWMAGQMRHMNSNSLLMIHSPSTICYGTAKDLRREAEMLDRFAQTTISVMAESTGMTEDEVRKAYYEDYEDHWMTAEEAVAAGLIDEIDSYSTEPIVEEPQQMSLSRLMKRFAEKGDEQAQRFVHEIQTLSSRISSAFQQRQAVAKTLITTDMTLEELQKSLADGTLSAEDVQAALAEHTTADEPAEQEGEMIAKAITDATQPLLYRIDKMATEIETLKSQPAEATPAALDTPKDPEASEDSPEAAYTQTMKEWSEAAATNGNPWAGA